MKKKKEACDREKKNTIAVVVNVDTINFQKKLREEKSNESRSNKGEKKTSEDKKGDLFAYFRFKEANEFHEFDCNKDIMEDRLMKKVVVFGSAIADMMVRSKSFRVLKSHQVEGGVALCEVYGGKLEAETADLFLGGGGTNVGLGLMRLGQTVKVVSAVGDDRLGVIIKGEMERYGLETDGLVEKEGKSGASVILVAGDGGRSIITHRGASQRIETREVDWQMVEKADWVQSSSLGGKMDLLEDLVIFASKKKIRVGLNPGKKELKAKGKMKALLPRVDFLSLNHMEAVEFWGGKLGDDKEMAKKFIEVGVKRVAITDGKKGAGLGDKDGWVKMAAFKTKSVDDTGAGDAFAAGIVAGILSEKKKEELLKMGLANGGSVVSFLGTKEGLLEEKEMKKWLEKEVKLVEEEWV